MEKLYCKIAIVKNDIGALKKQATNPFFKSKYLDLNDLLAALEPLLSQNGLLLLQPIEEGSVVTQIIDLDTSKKVVSSMVIPSSNDPQKLGSTITYFRRYTLQSLLGLQAEDDDGNAGSKQPQATKQPAKPVQLPPCDDTTFDKYVGWIAEGTKTKSGETITAETLRGRHTLNAAQEKALLLIQLEIE